jgi:hypothetical protein
MEIMQLFTPVAALVIAASVAPVVAAYGLFANWRARQRNAHDSCGGCGTSWTEIGREPARFLVQGREVCASCAHRLRRRFVAGVAGLASLSLLGLGLVIADLASYVGRGVHIGPVIALMALAPPVLLGALTFSTLRRMRSANRTSLAGPDAAPPRLGA